MCIPFVRIVICFDKTFIQNLNAFNKVYHDIKKGEYKGWSKVEKLNNCFSKYVGTYKRTSNQNQQEKCSVIRVLRIL